MPFRFLVRMVWELIYNILQKQLLCQLANGMKNDFVKWVPEMLLVTLLVTIDSVK